MSQNEFMCLSFFLLPWAWYFSKTKLSKGLVLFKWLAAAVKKKKKVSAVCVVRWRGRDGGFQPHTNLQHQRYWVSAMYQWHVPRVSCKLKNTVTGGFVCLFVCFYNTECDSANHSWGLLIPVFWSLTPDELMRIFMFSVIHEKAADHFCADDMLSSTMLHYEDVWLQYCTDQLGVDLHCTNTILLIRCMCWTHTLKLQQ